MSYKLVIAEKPSVAQSIAKVIGADKREDRYLEVHIPQELRIRSGGTERHSASN